MAKDKVEEKETTTDFRRIGAYHLVNPEKLDRAINGTVMSEGQTKGGVGHGADPAEVLAEYDRLGGLILKDGKYKVKTGGFYDVKKKEAFKKPKPVLVFQVNGETVEISADEPLPIEVQAAQIAEERKTSKRKKAAAVVDAKKAAKKKGKKVADEDEDAEDEDSEDDESEDDEEDADAEEGAELA